MALKSPRFAGNARLQSASNNAPTIRFGEKDIEAVRIIQKAYLELGFPMPVSTRKAGSPDGIFGTETAGVTRSFQAKHKLSPDGIVGRDTLGKLDQLFPATPTPPAPTAFPIRFPRFHPIKPKDGFDHTVFPHWQMVPARGGEKRIRLLDAEGLDVVSTQPQVCTLTEVPPVNTLPGAREFVLKGDLRGRSFIQARKGGRLFTQLQVGVKARKRVRVSFHFVRDRVGHATTRNPAQLDEWVRKANDILIPQANVEIVKHNVFNTLINQNLGPVVRFRLDASGNFAANDEWHVVTAKADRTAELNVFFVWEYEQDDTPAIDNTAAGTLESNILFEDNLPRPAESTLAHEVGHFLGVDEHSAEGQDLLMSPGRTDDRISRDHANIMNP